MNKVSLGKDFLEVLRVYGEQKVTEKGFLQVLRLYHVIVIPPVLHTRFPLMYHRYCAILAGDSVV
jgi:hypothetical protein